MCNLINILSKVNPDNNPDGYAGLDTDALVGTLCVLLVVICLVMLFYILYLHSKIDKLKDKINKDNQE